MKEKLPPNVLSAPNKPGPLRVLFVSEDRVMILSQRDFRKFVQAQGADADAVVAALKAGGFEQRFMSIGEGTPYAGPPELVLYAEVDKLSPCYVEWFNRVLKNNQGEN